MTPRQSLEKLPFGTAGGIINQLEADGFVIVPKEPTKEMCEAGNVALENATDSDWDSGPDGESHNSYTTIRSTASHEIFTAMVEAA